MGSAVGRSLADAGRVALDLARPSARPGRPARSGGVSRVRAADRMLHPPAVRLCGNSWPENWGLVGACCSVSQPNSPALGSPRRRQDGYSTPDAIPPPADLVGGRLRVADRGSANGSFCIRVPARAIMWACTDCPRHAALALFRPRFDGGFAGTRLPPANCANPVSTLGDQSGSGRGVRASGSTRHGACASGWTSLPDSRHIPTGHRHLPADIDLSRRQGADTAPTTRPRNVARP